MVGRISKKKTILANEAGAALFQIVMIGALIGILLYAISDFMVSQSKKSLRMIQRTDNVVVSSVLAIHINDPVSIHRSAATVYHSSGSTPVTFP